jgi:CRP/FNR family cyclic AMP-dependent transcriptional regulator
MNSEKSVFSEDYIKDQIVFLNNDKNYDLYLIKTGRLMIFADNGSQITPLAYLGPGEYLGEFSFFDKQPRSANVISLTDTTLIRVPVIELDKQFPFWLKTIAIGIIAKLRKTDKIIGKHRIRRKNVETIKPLSIEKQSHYYQLLQDHISS